MSQENDLEEVEIELTEENIKLIISQLEDLQNLISEAVKSGKFKEIVENYIKENK